MTLEGSMRQRVVKALKPLDAKSIENTCGAGTPDVNCTWGWIELKALSKAPVKPETPVRVPHFTPQQKIWLTKRTRAGGNCGVLLMVDREWFWMNGTLAVTYLGSSTMEQLRILASRYWPQTPTDKELLQCFAHLT